MAPGSDQKTEKPSPHKLQKARRQGQIAQGREIPAVAALVGAAAVLIAQGGQWASRWGGLWRETVALAGKTAGEGVPLQAAAILALKGGAALILPVLAAAVLSALALGAVQTRGLFAPSLLKFDWSRSNPLSGAGRLLSPRNGADALKMFLKAAGFALIAGRAVWSLAVQSPAELARGLPAMAAQVGRGFSEVLWDAILFFSALAAWDYYRQHRRWEADLRMSKQELKEEHREMEGNPQIKSRLKSLRKKWASRRMMSQVPKADVVVTNPTHLAVALRYRPRTSAPEVVAKGADLVAQRIRELARAHGVPLLENKPLAQLLYQKVDVGSPVPVALYQAVAEVLAYVYRLKNPRR